jgi:hypothetical protein
VRGRPMGGHASVALRATRPKVLRVATEPSQCSRPEGKAHVGKCRESSTRPRAALQILGFSVTQSIAEVHANSYPSRALCASASTSSVDIAVMSWAVANGLLRVKLLGTPFDGQSAEP